MLLGTAGYRQNVGINELRGSPDVAMYLFTTKLHSTKPIPAAQNPLQDFANPALCTGFTGFTGNATNITMDAIGTSPWVAAWRH